MPLLLAGLYLVLVQPFRLGDKVAVSCSLPSTQAANSGSSGSRSGAGSFMGPGSSSSGGAGPGSVQGWFEGVCEKVDLRYTVLRWAAATHTRCNKVHIQHPLCLVARLRYRFFWWFVRGMRAALLHMLCSFALVQ
jgi:hypothetical protein